MMIEFKLSPAERLDFLPGQFVNAMLPDKIARAYSISNYVKKDDGDVLELCIEYIEGGKGSEFFKNLSKNDEVILKAPFGRFVPNYYNFSTGEMQKSSGRIILIATGTGIVPLFNFVSDLSLKINDYQNILDLKEILVFHGVRHENENYYDDFFKSFSENFKNAGVLYQYQFWVSQPSEGYNGNKGRITESLKKIMPNITDEIYLCGNGATVLAIKGILISLGFQDTQIITERYN